VTREDFASVVAYLSAGTGKPMPREQAEVYYDLLSDLPVAAVRKAARDELAESCYPTLPAPGKLRQRAVEALHGALPAWGEGWAAVTRAVRLFGVSRARQALDSLPPLAREAAESFGWQAICDAHNGEALRAQFRDVYEALSLRESRGRALPPPGRPALPGGG